MNPRRPFGALPVGRFLETAEPIFFAASQTLAVALAIAVLGAAELRFLPQQRIDEISNAQCAAYIMSDGALFGIGAQND